MVPAASPLAGDPYRVRTRVSTVKGGKPVISSAVTPRSPFVHNVIFQRLVLDEVTFFWRSRPYRRSLPSIRTAAAFDPAPFWPCLDGHLKRSEARGTVCQI